MGRDVRQGQRQADEGLATAPDVAAGVLRGASDAYSAVNSYENHVVSGKRSFWGARSPHPAWTDEDSFLGSFAEGTTRSRSERKYETKVAFNPRNHHNDATVVD